MDERRVLLQSLDDGWLHRQDLRVSMLRLDLLHPVVSGNKWYKLKYNLAAALEQGRTGIATFGGPYSNHLAAIACAAKEAGLNALGLVRGLYEDSPPTATLDECRAGGMNLQGLSREEYALKNDPAFLEALQNRFPDHYFIPEGGANEAGRKGAGEIAALLPADTTHVCVSVGTGTTLAGLRGALSPSVSVLGWAPVKGGRYLQEELEQLLLATGPWSLTDEFHFGGFGKSTPELEAFIVAFYNNYQVPLDFVYTGKMMYGVREWLHRQLFPPSAHIVCIHTGGLQGNPPSLKALFAQTKSD